MEFLDLKFSENDFLGKDVSSLPDRVVGKAEYLKKMFDNVAKNELALGRFNALLDELDKRSRTFYFVAIGSNQTDITSTAAQKVEFPDVSVNNGGFVFDNKTHIKIPEAGIYLISFTAYCYLGQGKLIRFMLDLNYGGINVPCCSGCSLVPLQSGSYAEYATFSTLKRLRKDETLSLTLTPFGGFRLKDRELSVLRLKA